MAKVKLVGSSDLIKKYSSWALPQTAVNLPDGARRVYKKDNVLLIVTARHGVNTGILVRPKNTRLLCAAENRLMSDRQGSMNSLTPAGSEKVIHPSLWAWDWYTPSSNIPVLLADFDYEPDASGTPKSWEEAGYLVQKLQILVPGAQILSAPATRDSRLWEPADSDAPSFGFVLSAAADIATGGGGVKRRYTFLVYESDATVTPVVIEQPSSLICERLSDLAAVCVRVGDYKVALMYGGYDVSGVFSTSQYLGLIDLTNGYVFDYDGPKLVACNYGVFRPPVHNDQMVAYSANVGQAHVYCPSLNKGWAQSSTVPSHAPQAVSYAIGDLWGAPQGKAEWAAAHDDYIQMGTARVDNGVAVSYLAGEMTAPVAYGGGYTLTKGTYSSPMIYPIEFSPSIKYDPADLAATYQDALSHAAESYFDWNPQLFTYQPYTRVRVGVDSAGTPRVVRRAVDYAVVSSGSVGAVTVERRGNDPMGSYTYEQHFEVYRSLQQATQFSNTCIDEAGGTSLGAATLLPLVTKIPIDVYPQIATDTGYYLTFFGQLPFGPLCVWASPEFRLSAESPSGASGYMLPDGFDGINFHYDSSLWVWGGPPLSSPRGEYFTAPTGGAGGTPRTFYAVVLTGLRCPFAYNMETGDKALIPAEWPGLKLSEIGANASNQSFAPPTPSAWAVGGRGLAAYVYGGTLFYDGQGNPVARRYRFAYNRCDGDESWQLLDGPYEAHPSKVTKFSDMRFVGQHKRFACLSFQAEYPYDSECLRIDDFTRPITSAMMTLPLKGTNGPAASRSAGMSTAPILGGDAALVRTGEALGTETFYLGVLGFADGESAPLRVVPVLGDQMFFAGSEPARWSLGPYYKT